MKKYYYSLFAAASMMLAVTSCSQEEDFPQSSNDMTTFEISLEGATQSRAAGDGSKVDKLYYAVYDKETTKVIYPYQENENSIKYLTADKADGGWKLNLPLMRSETYDILFWAQAGENNAAYSFTELTDITINYTNALSNIEERDAFFNALDNFIISGSQNKIVLRRPFAQLNVATTMADWNDAVKLNANPVTKSAVTVSALATKFNVLTGVASEATEASVPFGANAIVNETLTLKRMVNGVETNVDYKHLAMNYLLPVGTKAPNGIGEYSAAEGKDMVEVEFTLYKNETEKIVNVKVPATPIQRNYRTNIIGDLLTGETFEIVIDKNFDGTENQEIEISADGIVKDAEGVYHITKSEGLWALANLVNNGSQAASTDSRAANVGYTFKGETFVLDCDIDLQGAEWTPIDNFDGTFDGKEKTIKDFKVEKAKSAGLFGTLGINAVIKNLKVEDATIVGNHYAGVIAGYGYVGIENCHVKNSTVTLTTEIINGTHDNGDKAGAIIGYLCEEGGNDYVMNCTADHVTIRGYRDIGGLVGIANGTATVSGNTISNSIIIIDKTHNYKNYTTDEEFHGGEVVGETATNATVENNTATEVEINYIGGEDYKGYYVDANGNYVATESKGISGIISENVTVINLADGLFEMPKVLANKTLSFVGSRNAELDLTPVVDEQNTNANLSFNGITVKYGTEIYKGLKHTSSVAYNDCAIIGLQFLYAPTTFTDCDLNSNGAEHCVWTYGADEVSFTNCTFTYGDRAVNCYSDQKDQQTEATFTDCTFTKVEGKATTGAIETNSSAMIGLELNINNCTVNEGDLWWISSWDTKNGANTVVTVDGITIFGYDSEGNRIAYVSNDKELKTAIDKAATEATTIITLAAGTYSEDIHLTLETRTQTGDLVFKAAEGANPVIAGTVTLGYHDHGKGSAKWDQNVTFEGITFDHANAATHSIDVQDVKSLTLKNCKIIGDGEYGLTSARQNDTGTSSIIGCTFENAGMQLLGNFATGLVIDDCDFNQSCVNVQAGNSVTVQNCRFTNTLKSANVGDSFYLIRSNSTPITVKGCTINIDSELSYIATNQDKWYILANRGTTNWTVENVAVTMSDAALKQTELFVTKCISTGAINTTNLTVNGKEYIAEGVLKNNEGEYDIYKSAGLSYDFGTEQATINLLADIEGTFVLKSNKTINGNDYKLGSVNLNGAENVTLKKITFDAATAVQGYDGKGNAKQYANIITGDSSKPNKGARNLVIDECTFEGKFVNGGVAIVFADQNRGSGQSGNITIKNSKFNTESGYYDIYAHYSGYGSFVIENNEFNSTLDRGLPIYLGRYQSGTPVIVKDNKFKNVATFDEAAYIQDHSSYGVSFETSGNTFAN